MPVDIVHKQDVVGTEPDFIDKLRNPFAAKKPIVVEDDNAIWLNDRPYGEK